MKKDFFENKSLAKVKLQIDKLGPEQKIRVDRLIASIDASNDSFALLRKTVTDIKTRIKKIEKKNLQMYNDCPERDIRYWIKGNIESIEKKYVGIDKAIKNYKLHQRYFVRHLKTSYSLGYYDNDINSLISEINQSNRHISEANDCIRITKRYFRNIDEMIKSHIHSIEIFKEYKRRSALLPPSEPAP